MQQYERHDDGEKRGRAIRQTQRRPSQQRPAENARQKLFFAHPAVNPDHRRKQSEQERFDKRFKVMNILAKPINFFKEVRSELSKVSWSTRKELLASTILVITVTGILTIFIGIVDLGLSRFLSVVFK